MSREKPDFFYKQSAVIPIKSRGDDWEVLLITSRKKKRWLVPKGIVEKGYTPAASAAKEALEEAGILGKPFPQAIGKYRYKKWGGVCSVEVFVMVVDRELDKWLESHRHRRWVSLDKAIKLVNESGLRKNLERLADYIAKNHV